jgi:hypothetical protein
MGGWREDKYSGNVEGGLAMDGKDSGYGAGWWGGSEAGASAIGREGAANKTGVADWDQRGS